MEDLRSGIEHLKQAKAHMSEANGIMSDCISKINRLEEENVALKAKLTLTYMELPIDADGVPIRIGDKMDVDGDCMTVLGYRLYNGGLHLIVKKAESAITYTPDPTAVRHFKHQPPDSWEKLEEDAKKMTCDYALAPCDEDGLTTCDGCRFQNGGPCHRKMTLDVLERAKKLAGIEEARNGHC